MDSLLIDFSQVYGKNGTNEISRSVYNTRAALPNDTVTPQAPKLSFESMLSDSLKKVNQLQIQADKKIRDLSIGDTEDISDVVLATSRADTALRLVMEIRNKFLDAYQALSRITG